VTSLEGRGLACTRGVVTLFRDLSFRIAGGEWLAVRGPNGGGKTTLLRCVAGLTHAPIAARWSAAATSSTRGTCPASRTT
jgi:ABC-type transport system involved in cytochrome c biogenesis ATPase subunit